MKRIRPFTLLEIVICMAILGLVAGFTGWGITNMVSDYQFNKSIGLFLADLKKAHLIALADRTDLELHIWKTTAGYQYQFRSDDPLPCFISKKMKLRGVKEVKKQQKLLNVYTTPLYSSGRVGECCDKLIFLKKEEDGWILNLKKPHEFDLKRLKPSQ